MEAKLIMFKRNGQRKDFTVKKKTTSIGRGEDCDLQIPLLSVSRHHCEIVKGDDELRVRDLASSNGSYVNNRRINEISLKAGDRVVIGPVVFTIQIDGVPEEVTPIKTKAAKAAEAVGAEVAASGDEDEVIELEADVGPTTSDDSDPISALEALASMTKDKKKKK